MVAWFRAYACPPVNVSGPANNLLTLHRSFVQMQRAPSAEQVIETPRLLLISVTEAMLDADRDGRGLGELLGAVVPNSWPPEYWDSKAIRYLYERVHRSPQYRGWCRYVALKQAAAAPLLIGGCGCTEPPETLDEVEIGYSILGEFRRHGYVTEAINALVPWIFSYSNVHSVCAQTYPHLGASIGVLRKCGFIMDGTGKDPGTVLFRLNRP
jgi:ribosomal-protein-alanine N-acetyltransferase